MADVDALRRKWDVRHRADHRVPLPAAVLVENSHLLPPAGAALDLACGLGGNALFLAGRGLATTAWDLSPVAIGRLHGAAQRRGLALRAEVRDLTRLPPEPGTFDVVAVCHFLERGLIPAIRQALRPAGLVFYQTFVREAVSDRGPSNPAYRLERNELLRLFDGLVVRFYREEGRCGATGQGTRDLAMLVAQRPS